MMKTQISLDLLLRIKDYIELRELQYEHEYGDTSREVDDLIKDGDMPDIYWDICKIIKGIK